jgi:hypothetical protein
LVYTCCHAFNYKSSLICKEGLTCLWIHTRSSR